MARTIAPGPKMRANQPGDGLLNVIEHQPKA